MPKFSYTAGSADLSSLASIYLKLDASNDPVTGGLEIDNTLFVDGAADAIQLTVQAHSSQTANIVEIQDSSANVLSGVDERGVMFSDGGSDATNLFLGNNTGNPNATGTSNVGMGNNALVSLTSGFGNTLLGANAGDAITDGENNMGIGGSSLGALTTGDRNVAIGVSTLAPVTTGKNNVAIGHSALSSASSTNSSSNVVLGYQAGLNAGSSNIIIGFQSGNKETGSGKLIIDNITRADTATELTNAILYGVMAAAPTSQTLNVNALLGVNATPTAQLHVTGNADIIQTVIKGHSSQTANLVEIQDSSANVLAGYDERGVPFSDLNTVASNIFYGPDAGNTSVTGSGNIGIGNLALNDLTSGGGNFAIGNKALELQTDGDNNLAIGNLTLGKAISGSNDNVALGNNSMKVLTTGDRNVAIGNSSLVKLVTGLENVAIGYNALGSQLVGRSVAVGEQAGAASSAVENVFLGHDAGVAFTSGARNIIIGKSAGAKQTTLSDLFIVHNLLSASAAAEITDSLFYGVMAATPASQSLRVNANLTSSQGRIKNTTRATGTYTVLVTDDNVFCDTDGGAFTATLPAGVDGQRFRIMNTGTGGLDLTIAPNGSELLIGVNSNFTLVDGEALYLVYETTEGWA